MACSKSCDMPIDNPSDAASIPTNSAAESRHAISVWFKPMQRHAQQLVSMSPDYDHAMSCTQPVCKPPHIGMAVLAHLEVIG